MKNHSTAGAMPRKPRPDFPLFPHASGASRNVNENQNSTKQYFYRDENQRTRSFTAEDAAKSWQDVAFYRSGDLCVGGYEYLVLLRDGKWVKFEADPSRPVGRAISIHDAADWLLSQGRGEQLRLTDDELAFYDALAQNESAVQVLGDDKLAVIARELVERVKQNVTIDWTIKETVRAKMRVLVKKTLRKYGYPPDLQERATVTVLEQAEALCAGWAA